MRSMETEHQRERISRFFSTSSSSSSAHAFMLPLSYAAFDGYTYSINFHTVNKCFRILFFFNCVASQFLKWFISQRICFIISEGDFAQREFENRSSFYSCSCRRWLFMELSLKRTNDVNNCISCVKATWTTFCLFNVTACLSDIDNRSHQTHDWWGHLKWALIYCESINRNQKSVQKQSHLNWTAY